MKFKSTAYLVVVSLLLSYNFVLAQKNLPEKALLDNPYHSVLNHLKYLQEDNYKPDLASKSLFRGDYTEIEIIELSNKLKKIYDARGLYINVESISKDSNFYDSLRDNQEFVVHESLPEIFLKKYGNKWQYSRASVNSIDRLFNETFIFGIDRLIEFLPDSFKNKVFGFKIWQLLGIFILVLVAFVLDKILEIIIRSIVNRIFVANHAHKMARKIIFPVTKPFSILIVLGLVLIVLPGLQLPIQINKYLVIGVKALVPVLLTVVAYKMTDLLSEFLMNQAEKTESTLDDQLVPLLRKILKVFVVIVGGMFVLLNLNVNIIPLLTGLSIGSLALALAAQDTLKNFFGSIMIFVDRPFQVGHWITTSDVDGIIEEVGFRSTRIRTFRNSLQYVPNGKLADSSIDNHGLRNYRRFFTKIGIMYDTPPQLIEVFVEGLKDLALKHPKTVKDKMEIHFNDLADYSLNIMFYIFFDVPTWSEELKARDEILIEIVKLADALGVQFAFPTTTLHMETFPGKPGLSPSYELNKEKLKSIKDNFINTYQPIEK